MDWRVKLTLWIVIAGLFSTWTGFAQGTAKLRLYRPILRAGQSGVVEARIDCGGRQCGLFSTTLRFDPAKVRVESVELGLYLGSVTKGLAFVVENTVDNEGGEVHLAAASLGMPAPPPDNLLFSLSVTAVTSGMVEIDVESFELGDLQATPVPVLIEMLNPATLQPTLLSSPSPAVIIVTATPISPVVTPYARVFTHFGDTLNIRATPSAHARILEELPLDAVVSIIGGPVEAEGFRWWNVLSPTGTSGWSVDSANDVQTLHFANNLQPTLMVRAEIVGLAPLYEYGQAVFGLSGDVWTRPDTQYGKAAWHIASPAALEISGIPFGGYLSDGQPTWWYFVRIPGDAETRGWIPEAQLARR